MGYIDWSITVPLQMIEFNLILKAAKAPIGPAGFWKLLIGTVLMLAFGYTGESGTMNPWMGFIAGMAGWGFILNEIFARASSSMPKPGQSLGIGRHPSTSVDWSHLLQQFTICTCASTGSLSTRAQSCTGT